MGLSPPKFSDPPAKEWRPSPPNSGPLPSQFLSSEDSNFWPLDTPILRLWLLRMRGFRCSPNELVQLRREIGGAQYLGDILGTNNVFLGTNNASLLEILALQSPWLGHAKMSEWWVSEPARDPSRGSDRPGGAPTLDRSHRKKSGSLRPARMEDHHQQQNPGAVSQHLLLTWPAVRPTWLRTPRIRCMHP